MMFPTKEKSFSIYEEHLMHKILPHLKYSHLDSIDRKHESLRFIIFFESFGISP